jgi:hypothetical protein
VLFSIRISLPDLPGTLGSVATAFGKGGANILTLDVIEREGGMAVDDLCVEAPEGMQAAIALARREVPGLVVESLRFLEAFRDVMAPLDLAVALAEAEVAPLEILVERAPEALGAEWCVAVEGAVEGGNGGLEVTGSSIGSPDLTGLDAPWLPLQAATRLHTAGWMPPAWREGPGSNQGQGRFALAAAPLGPNSAVLVGRRRGPQFRTSELVQLGLLVRIAAAAQKRHG